MNGGREKGLLGISRVTYRCIITPDFKAAHAPWSATVKLLAYDSSDSAFCTLRLRRMHENRKDAFITGAPKARRGAEEHWSDVHESIRSVRGHILGILDDSTADAFKEYLLWRRTQQHGLGRASQARRVEVRPKNDDATISGAERLQSLVALLAIIQAWTET